jgi:type II secretory pathway pseudopilin PulG
MSIGGRRLFSRSARRAGRSAFTFVEVLAALAFLGILIPVIVSALTLANRAAVIAERTSIATQLAENQLNELTVANAWSTAESRGDFAPEWPGYRWELTRAAWESGAMTELTMTVFFPVQGREHETRLSTLVNETLTAQ